jgi:hypothetical protein
MTRYRSWQGRLAGIAATGALLGLAVAAPATAAPTPAAPAAETAHYAHKAKVTATVAQNTWATPSYAVTNYVDNTVTVAKLGGTLCAPNACWFRTRLRTGVGGTLWASAKHFAAGTVNSPVRTHRGKVYSQIVVGPWTSATNVHFITRTCC